MHYFNSYKDLKLKPSSKYVIDLLDYIEIKGGKLVHSSGHGKQEGKELKGTLIYQFENSQGVMIAINKDLPSLYIKKLLRKGKTVFESVPNAENYLSDTYSLSKKGESAKGYNTHLDRFDFLNPSKENPSILLKKVGIAIGKKLIDTISSNHII